MKNNMLNWAKTYGAIFWLWAYCALPIYIDMKTRVGIAWSSSNPWFAMLSASIFLFPVFVWPKRVRIWTIVMFLLLWIPAGFRIAHYAMFGKVIDEGGWFALFDTHLAEAAGFVGGYFSPLIVLTLIGFIAAFALTLRIRSIEKLPRFKLFMQITFVIMLASLEKVARTEERYRPAVFEMKEMLKKYGSLSVSRNRSFPPFAGLKKSYSGKQTYVFVIGESDAREHHSIYGYPRQTNPRLAEIANELAAYKNVATPFPTTLKALPYVLTFATYDDKEPITKKGSVVNMLNDAGFKTWWLDYNMDYGTGAKGVSVMAADANVARFRSDIQGNDGFGDMKLIPELKAALADPAESKAIVLHLDGQHWAYKDRYPATFEKFSDKSSARMEKVAQYDNATLYLDHTLSSMIETLRGADGVSALLYFPDHGEDAIDESSCFCHATAIARNNMFEIPFILWRNKEFLRTRPLSIDTARKFNTQDFPFAAAHIAGIAGLDGTETRSPFSASYAEPKVLYKKELW